MTKKESLTISFWSYMSLTPLKCNFSLWHGMKSVCIKEKVNNGLENNNKCNGTQVLERTLWGHKSNDEKKNKSDLTLF